jgi:hypothetical protein
MIRIDLVDNTNNVKHVDFHVVPVTAKKDFTCIPAGIMPLRIVVRLSQKVEAGRVFGRMGKYLWYRLKQTAPGRHKSPMSGRQHDKRLPPSPPPPGEFLNRS